MVAGLLLVAIYLLWKVRDEFAPQVVTLLVIALGLKLVSELLFSAYISIYSHTVVVAHLLRLVSFYMIYLADYLLDRPGETLQHLAAPIETARADFCFSTRKTLASATKN